MHILISDSNSHPKIKSHLRLCLYDRLASVPCETKASRYGRYGQAEKRSRATCVAGKDDAVGIQHYSDQQGCLLLCTFAGQVCGIGLPYTIVVWCPSMMTRRYRECLSRLSRIPSLDSSLTRSLRSNTQLFRNVLRTAGAACTVRGKKTHTYIIFYTLFLWEKRHVFMTPVSTCR